MTTLPRQRKAPSRYAKGNQCNRDTYFGDFSSDMRFSENQSKDDYEEGGGLQVKYRKKIQGGPKTAFLNVSQCPPYPRPPSPPTRVQELKSDVLLKKKKKKQSIAVRWGGINV